jgi:PmbA protein
MPALSRDQINRIMDKVLGQLTDCTQAELQLSSQKKALSRFSSNEIQQNLAQQALDLRLMLVDSKGRQGIAAGNRADDAGLDGLVATARNIASFQQPARDLMPQLASCDTAERDLLDEATAEWGPEEKAQALAGTFELAREKQLEASGILESGWAQFSLGNSAGLRCHYKTSSASFSTTMSGQDVSGWSEGRASRHTELDVAALSHEAREIALRAVNPESAEPGAWTVLLPPAAVADLVMFLNWMGFGAQDYLAGTSPLAGKAGQKLFSDLLCITDDCNHPLAAGIPFDDEGVSRQKVNLIDRGTFMGPVYDRLTAKEAGKASTGHGFSRPNPHGPFPGNLVVAPGKASMQELIAGTRRGLLVTHLHYTNVQNPQDLTLTGMTRDGLFLVENGEIVKPVRNMRFTESLLKAFANIEAVSSDQQLHGGFFGGGFVLPGMKINDFHFTSSSSF